MEWEHNVEIKNETDMYDYEVVQFPLNVKFEIDDYLVPSEEINFEDEFEQRFLSEGLIKAVQPQQEIYNCKYCKQKFENSQQLFQHNLIHMQVNLPRLYECEICNSCHTGKSGLSNHIKNHYPQSYTCTFCSKTFGSYKIWHEHKTFVHSSTWYLCIICNRQFKCKKYLNNHVRRIHEYKKECNKIRNEEKNFNCLKCSKVFYRKESLKCHMRYVHSDKVECDICGSRFGKSNLKQHKSRVHYNDGKNYPCNLCVKIFKSPRSLARHKNGTHKLIQMWQDCFICNSRFKTKGLLQKHFKLAHSLEKYFECTFCLMKFASNELLQKHIKRCSQKYTKNNVKELKELVSDNNFDVKIKVEVLD